MRLLRRPETERTDLLADRAYLVHGPGCPKLELLVVDFFFSIERLVLRSIDAPSDVRDTGVESATEGAELAGGCLVLRA